MLISQFHLLFDRSGDDKDSTSVLNVSFGEEETRSSDQLLELIRFLRREKEITISRFEVSEAENQRLKTQVEQAERQLADAQVRDKCFFLNCLLYFPMVQIYQSIVVVKVILVIKRKSVMEYWVLLIY